MPQQHSLKWTCPPDFGIQKVTAWFQHAKSYGLISAYKRWRPDFGTQKLRPDFGIQKLRSGFGICLYTWQTTRKSSCIAIENGCNITVISDKSMLICGKTYRADAHHHAMIFATTRWLYTRLKPHLHACTSYIREQISNQAFFAYKKCMCIENCTKWLRTYGGSYLKHVDETQPIDAQI